MGDGHGGIDKVSSSWTLRGWSPPWTRATVTLRGLKSMIGSMPKVGMLIFGKYQMLASNWLATNFFCQPHKKLPIFGNF